MEDLLIKIGILAAGVVLGLFIASLMHSSSEADVMQEVYNEGYQAGKNDKIKNEREE